MVGNDKAGAVAKGLTCEKQGKKAHAGVPRNGWADVLTSFWGLNRYVSRTCVPCLIVCQALPRISCSYAASSPRSLFRDTDMEGDEFTDTVPYEQYEG